MSQSKTRTKSRVTSRPTVSRKASDTSAFFTVRADVARKADDGGSGAFFSVGRSTPLKVGRPGSGPELAADSAADRVVAGRPAADVVAIEEPTLQSQPEEEEELQMQEEEEELQMQEEEEELQMQEEEEELQMQEEEEELQMQTSSLPRKRESRPIARVLDSRFRGNDVKVANHEFVEGDGLQMQEGEEELQTQEGEEELQTQEEEEELQTQEEEEELQAQEEEEELQTQEGEEELQAQEEEEELQMQTSSLPRKRESRPIARVLDSRFRGNDVAGGNDVSRGSDPQDQVIARLQSTRGNGSQLPPAAKSKMETAFRRDFSGIRIHDDALAVQLTKAFRAKAFAIGRDVYFNEGQFRPGSRDGDHLLAHELAHTVQQGVSEKTDIQLDAEPGQVHRKDDDEDKILVRPELIDAIHRARGEIGKVNAKKTEPDDTRQGWQRLLEYFQTAFGGKDVIHPDVIKYIKKVADGQGNKKDAMPSWCGIFVWWALKLSGIPIPDWKLGVSILGWVVARKPGELPQKGDIAYREKNDHFAIVSGVENPKDAAGKDFKSIRVATINGNTSGEDNLGGQIEEKWEPIGKWLAFFNPVAKLDLPPVPLVETTYEPDAETVEAGAAGAGAPGGDGAAGPPPEAAPPTEVAHLEEDFVTPPEPVPEGAAEVGVELPEPPAPPAKEDVAKVEKVSLEGPSEDTMTSFIDASPSQMAVTEPDLGQMLDKKIGEEQSKEAENPPELAVKTSGKVEEGLTPPDQIPVPAGAELSDGVMGPDPGPLDLQPHQNAGETPSNDEAEKEIDKKSDGGFLSWLRDNIKSFMSSIRTKDPGLNTKAGERPNVQLEGEAAPERMDTQRGEASDQLKSQRDATTTALKNHPGQTNIQPREVNEKKTAKVSAERTATVELTPDPGVKDYAEAPLPADVRAKADELLKPKLDSNLAEARSQTTKAAEKRADDKKTETGTAEAEAQKISAQADKDQRDIVVENRGKVAAQQKEGIEGAYKHVDEFNKEADTEQVAARKDIAGKVKDTEGKARTELDKGEADAETKKKEGEEEAAAKKRKLEEEQKNDSWWDRAVNAVKNAVKAITEAIDAVFTKIREAVKTIIEKAKQAAIGLINAARDWVVDKLNKFRDWAKGMVDKYLKDRFPALAAAINSGIDSVVDVAVAGVNFVADTAIAGVEAVADALAAAIDRILEIYQTALKAAVQIAGAVLTGDFAEALKIAIQAGCDIAGIDSKPIFDFFDRAANALMDILNDPVGFFSNLVEAVGGGIRQFATNIKKHLISGLIGWLTGALSEVPITLPETFDFKGILSLVLQILGLTYENIKARIIKKYPPAEKVFAVIEKTFEIVKRLVTEGPIALWHMIQEALANLKETVLGAIRNFVIVTVVKEAITWLLGLLNPAGAIVKVLKLLFDFVMFLVERFNQIKDFVMSVYESVAAIASGALTKAMAAVEDALARSLPVVISLLASLAGLGGIGKTVKNIIGKVAKPVNKVIDSVIDKVVTFAKKLLKKGKEAAGKVKEALVNWWKARKGFKGEDGSQHSLYFKGSGASAKLTVKSDEQPYTRFLNWANAEAKTQEQKTALAAAKAVAEKIDKEVKAPLGSGLTEEQKKAEGTKKEKRINDLLSELAKHTGILFGTDLPKWKKPEYGSKNSADFGTGMKAEILSKNEMPAGSGPTQAKHATYDILNDRRQAGGAASYYIRGHLLNDNLGGPGQWENMTPLSRSGNKQHEGKVESLVKAGVNSGAIMKYEVTPKYGARGGKASLIAEVQKGRTPAAGKTLEAVIKAEDHVPSALECSADRLEDKGGGELKSVKSDSWTVTNAVEREPSSYHLSDSKKIDPVRINGLTSAAPLIAVEIPETIANSIFAAVQKRTKEERPPFGTYKTLAEETTGLTEETAKEWNQKGYIIL